MTEVTFRSVDTGRIEIYMVSEEDTEKLFLVLDGVQSEERIMPSLDQIKDIVSSEMGYPVERGSRKQDLVLTRQLFCLFAKQETFCSLKSIGIYIGNYDHTTVISAIRTVSKRIETEDKVREISKSIRNKIRLCTLCGQPKNKTP